MTTLTLQVDDEVLARAVAASRDAGLDVSSQLLAKLEEIGAGKSNRAHEAIKRFVERAQKNPVQFSGTLPGRDERNSR